MIQPAADTYQFHLGRPAYIRTTTLGVLMLLACLLCAAGAIALSGTVWTSYNHTLTPYLKWQDALVGLLWSVALITFGGSLFIAWFLRALWHGYRKGMLTLVGASSLTVRDLAAGNLGSIFWLMNTAFWCFVLMLVGLLPAVLIGWTLSFSNPVLIAFATALAIVLSLGGLGVSLIALIVIVVGCVGAVSFCRKLGTPQTYVLNSHSVLRIDQLALSIVYPGKPETMLDLKQLDADDLRILLTLLHQGWLHVEGVWNPGLGEEIQAALKEVTHEPKPVLA